MILFYENTILNKIIVSLTFKNLDDQNVIPINSLEDIPQLKSSEEKYEEDLIILLSTNMGIESLEEYIRESPSYKIQIIMKDADEIQTDNYTITKWQIPWTTARNLSTTEFDIDREVIDSVWAYYTRIPYPTERRIVEYLDSIKNSSRNVFIQRLTDMNLQMICSAGKVLLENKSAEIEKDRLKSSSKNIKGHIYSLCVSHYLETGFQIIDKTNADFVLLFELDLKTFTVLTKIISKDKSKTHCFKSYVTFKIGSHIEGFKIDFDKFVTIVNG